MTARALVGALGLVGALALVVAAGLGPAVAAPVQGSPASRQDSPTVALVGQSPSVEEGGAFALHVRVDDPTSGGELRLAVHERVRSRSELARTFAGSGLRGVVHREVLPLEALALDEEGNARVELDLAEDTAAGRSIRTPGVYPLVVEVDGAAEALVTHLVLSPAPAEDGPPLDVAVVAAVGGPPRPVDRPPLDSSQMISTLSFVDAVLAAPRVTVTLAPTPDLLARLDGSDDSGAAALLDRLREAARTVPVLALPYVETSPDTLQAAGLGNELRRQVDHGAAIQRQVLGAAPTQDTWLAAADLDLDGLALLGRNDVRRVVVQPDQVEPLFDAILSPAGPFELDTAGGEVGSEGEPTPVTALATDSRLVDLLGDRTVPAPVTVSRLLADLAMLWFEQPAIPRATVIGLDPSVDSNVVRDLLAGLRDGALFRPVPIDRAFDEARPLTDRDGAPVARRLVPEEPAQLGEDLDDRLAGLRDERMGLTSMVGRDAPAVETVESHLLRSLASGIGPSARDRELDAAAAAIKGVTAGIGTQEAVTVTLTAREGRVPLTIRNETGMPVDVRVELSSPKLDLPSGDTLSLTLSEQTTRLDIKIRTRASGSFPVDIHVTSPDGRLELASTTYSVRSTAVSGVGLVLSVGAALFLAIWWARHWREHRRSSKLMTDTSG